MDWTEAVFRITSQDPKSRVQGTGFACGRDGEAVIVVTCWHVVRDIGREHLEINKLPGELLSDDGDDELDLAVLRVIGLRVAEVLRLGIGGTSKMPFETYGYEPIGRPLSATLGSRTRRPHPSSQDVPAWDYYLCKDGGELEQIKDGYSGAPVYDPQSQTVVAVITHRKGNDMGFAIDLENLERVYPSASQWFTAGNAPPTDDEYLGAQGEVLAKMLDHGEHLATIESLFKLTGSGSARDRGIAIVDACSDDWPSYLADHVYLDPWPDSDGAPPAAIPMFINRADKHAFWDELIRAIPGVEAHPDIDTQRGSIRDWVNAAELRVIHVTVDLARNGRNLPTVIQGAHEALAALGDLAQGARLLVLFAVVAGGRPPFWWPLFKRLKIQNLGCCQPLAPLRPLDRSDIEAWHSRFPPPLQRYYDRDRLKAELLTLFDDDKAVIRYEDARRCLVDDKAIERARK